MKNKDIDYSEIVSAYENIEHEPNCKFLDALNSADEYVVWYGAKGCGIKKIKESIPMLFELLGKQCQSLGDTDVRRIVAWSLSNFSFDLIHPLVDTVDESNILLIEGLCDTIGLLKDERGLLYLDKFMSIYEDSIYLWSSLSLSKIGDKSIPVISKYIESEKTSFRQKFYLFDALKKINTQSSKYVLENYLNDSKYSNIKSHILM